MPRRECFKRSKAYGEYRPSRNSRGSHTCSLRASGRSCDRSIAVSSALEGHCLCGRSAQGTRAIRIVRLEEDELPCGARGHSRTGVSHHCGTVALRQKPHQTTPQLCAISPVSRGCADTVELHVCMLYVACYTVQTPLSCMALNLEGTRLATASEKARLLGFLVPSCRRRSAADTVQGRCESQHAVECSRTAAAQRKRAAEA
jgi:hypothetical protein